MVEYLRPQIIYTYINSFRCNLINEPTTLIKVKQMAKGKETKEKSTKKVAAKTLKEKRAAKEIKRKERGS